MRIGIDARPLAGSRTGIGSFLAGTLGVLAKQGAEHEFVLYSSHAFEFDLPNARWRVCTRKGVKGTNNVLWLQLYGWWLAGRDDIDVFWGPGFYVPLLLPRRIPALVTVHDLVHILFPHTMQFRTYTGMRLLLGPSVRRADHVTADSHATAADLQRYMRVPAQKITVVTPGVGRGFHPRSLPDVRRIIESKFSVAGPYLLTVGTLEPRKNLVTVIRAHSSLPQATRLQFPLLVVGGTGWKNSALHAAAKPLMEEGTLRFLGYVEEEDLPVLYAGATLLLYPSLYEGFGIPIVEAMASGLPVVASDIRVTREIAGDAAEYVAPLDVEGWVHATASLLADERRRLALGERGLARVSEFSYESSARQVLTILESLVGTRR